MFTFEDILFQQGADEIYTSIWVFYDYLKPLANPKSNQNPIQKDLKQRNEITLIYISFKFLKYKFLLFPLYFLCYTENNKIRTL